MTSSQKLWSLIAVLGWAIILCYLEDFFAILPTQANHGRYGQELDEVRRDLKLTVNTKKSTTDTAAEFLGTELDSIAMEARLPLIRLERARGEVDAILTKESTPYADLVS